MPQSQACTPQRAASDAVVPRHAYLRVHLHPKRFPAAYDVDWAVRCQLLYWPLPPSPLWGGCRKDRAALHTPGRAAP